MLNDLCFFLIFVFNFQDDSYVDSYISTIGVDFVSFFLSLCFCLLLSGDFKDVQTSSLVEFVVLQKIRTVELDGKTIKLQIVS